MDINFNLSNAGLWGTSLVYQILYMNLQISLLHYYIILIIRVFFSVCNSEGKQENIIELGLKG